MAANPPKNIYGKPAHQLPKQKAQKSSGGKVGRPKSGNAFTRFGRSFKTHATGETKNSPTTVPNIIFFLGLALIIAAGFKSGRFQKFLNDIWTVPQGNTPSQVGTNISTAGPDIWNQIKVVAFQLAWLFGMVVAARFIPPISRIFLIIVSGMWILFLIQNPQVLQWLNAQNNAAIASTSGTVTETPTPPTPPRGVNPGPQLTLQQAQSNIQKLLAARSGGQL